MEKFSKEKCDEVLQGLSKWKKVEGREAITRTYRFKDFNEAFGWMARIALAAEKMDHHPEWYNIWNRVDVVLTTYDAKGLTQKDVLLAKIMDTYFK